MGYYSIIVSLVGFSTLSTKNLKDDDEFCMWIILHLSENRFRKSMKITSLHGY